MNNAGNAPAAQQIAMPGAFAAKFLVVRALTKQGVSYEKSVDAYEPYDALKDPDPSMRSALGRIAARALETGGSAFVIVNNRWRGTRRERLKRSSQRCSSYRKTPLARCPFVPGAA